MRNSLSETLQELTLRVVLRNGAPVEITRRKIAENHTVAMLSVIDDIRSANGFFKEMSFHPWA